jgi:hypothetical protein
MEKALSLPVVRVLAQALNAREIGHNEESRVISFAVADTRINVYCTTGTVGTCLDHLVQGRTQLFRRKVSDGDNTHRPFPMRHRVMWCGMHALPMRTKSLGVSCTPCMMGFKVLTPSFVWAGAMRKVAQIFMNPRVHTGRGYKRKKDMPEPLLPLPQGPSFDCPVWGKRRMGVC